MIPWQTTLPTIEQVEAHANEHPLPSRWRKTKNGLWLRLYPPIVWPVFTSLGMVNDVVHWDLDPWHGKWACGEPDESKWLPCTAEGIPVCLLPKDGA